MIHVAETLARVPLFGSLSGDAIRQLDKACAWRRVRAKKWVLDYQADGTDVFFVLRGHLRVIITAVDREIILHDVGAGEFFGELAAIDQQPRSAGILAVTDAAVARMPASVFRSAVREHPDVCDKVLQALAARQRALLNRTSERSTFNAQQRLYAELLRLARAPANRSSDRAIVSPPPTHAELAARVSVSRETVTRELNALDRNKLIERRRGAIVLLDTSRLRRMLAESDEV